MKKIGDRFSTQALKGIQQEELQTIFDVLEKVLKNIQERKENDA